MTWVQSLSSQEDGWQKQRGQVRKEKQQAKQTWKQGQQAKPQAQQAQGQKTKKWTPKGQQGSSPFGRPPSRVDVHSATNRQRRRVP